MRSVEILRVEILAGVPLYRLTVDGETLLRRAPMRRVVEALAVMQAREERPSSGPSGHLPPEGEGLKEPEPLSPTRLTAGAPFRQGGR